MFQPRQHDLLTRLLNLARQKDLVEDGVDLVKVEDEVELADVAEEGVEHLDEEVDGLEEGELVVVCVDAGAEEEAGVAAVDDFVVAELDKVGLVLLVARGDEAVDFALELDLFVVAVGGVPFGEAGFAPILVVSSLRWWFFAWVEGEGGIVVCAARRDARDWGGDGRAYCLFWMRMKESMIAEGETEGERRECLVSSRMASRWRMNNTEVCCRRWFSWRLLNYSARLVSRGAGAHGSDAIGGRAEKGPVGN